MSKKVGTGVVASNPTVFQTKKKLTKARVDIKVDGIVATYWSDDPADDHVFSFIKGDEVEVEYWEQGNFWNAKIISPYGSADAREAAAESMEKVFAPKSGDFENEADELAAVFAGARAAVLNNPEMSAMLSELSEDQSHQVVMQATASVFIELNKRGLNYEEAFSR